MTPIVIAGIVLAAGAVVLGVSWYWTKKLLDKREDGLDRRQAEIEKREFLLEQPVRVETVTMKPVQIAYAKCVTYRELARFGEIDPEGWTDAQRQIIQMHRSTAIENCLNAARDFLTVTMERDEQDAALVIHARMWCCKPDEL